jgi:hypothetical protein
MSKHFNFNSKPKRFVVETKKTALSIASLTHKARFVKAKGDGLIADIRVGGRFVFPDKRGPQPRNDGKFWSFQIVGENPKQTVYFARVIEAGSAETQPMKIVINGKGKIVCLNRRPVKLFMLSKPGKKPLAEFRQGFAKGQAFEVDTDDRDYYYDGDGDDSGCGCDCGNGCGFDCSASGEEDTVAGEVNPIYDCLPTKPVNCFACGFEDCRCDGTDQLGGSRPARETLNVLA